ncbi:MAG: tyrosine-type recombinase/integrase [candidate division Zixibacteria bacterium]|nr:tyrosine-type recombinase/integrase [candidate division Zixibacteria bacterium]
MRENPMIDPVYDELRSLIADSDCIFYGNDGTCLKSTKTGFVNTAKGLGIPDFTFHDLRDTFAGHWTMSGVDLSTVDELLGHKTTNATLRYLGPDNKYKTVQSLKFFNGYFLYNQGSYIPQGFKIMREWRNWQTRWT